MAKSTEKKMPRHRDDPEQSKLFIEKAREIGAEGGCALPSDKLIGQLAKKAPEPRKRPKTHGDD